jgi:hypothetical protein
LARGSKIEDGGWRDDALRNLVEDRGWRIARTGKRDLLSSSLHPRLVCTHEAVPEEVYLNLDDYAREFRKIFGL